MHPPSPLLKVGPARARGLARLLAAEARPLQLKQHCVQRADGAGFYPARPKRGRQRAKNTEALDAVAPRRPHAIASRLQRLLHDVQGLAAAVATRLGVGDQREGPGGGVGVGRAHAGTLYLDGVVVSRL